MRRESTTARNPLSKETPILPRTPHDGDMRLRTTTMLNMVTGSTNPQGNFMGSHVAKKYHTQQSPT